MFTGAISFKLTPSGWMITKVYDFLNTRTPLHFIKMGNTLYIEGTFRVKPKHGFCRTPHNYLTKGVK